MLRGLVPGSDFRGKFKKEEENVSKLLDNKFFAHFRKNFVWGSGGGNKFQLCNHTSPGTQYVLILLYECELYVRPF